MTGISRLYDYTEFRLNKLSQLAGHSKLANNTSSQQKSYLAVSVSVSSGSMQGFMKLLNLFSDWTNIVHVSTASLLTGGWPIRVRGFFLFFSHSIWVSSDYWHTSHICPTQMVYQGLDTSALNSNTQIVVLLLHASILLRQNFWVSLSAPQLVAEIRVGL